MSGVDIINQDELQQNEKIKPDQTCIKGEPSLAYSVKSMSNMIFSMPLQLPSYISVDEKQLISCSDQAFPDQGSNNYYSDLMQINN